MSMKTVIQNFAKDLKKTMHTTESLFDLITAYLPKFEDNADITFSNDERVVGVWLDGKKIYEKTFTFETEKQITGDTWNANFATITGITNILSAYSIGASGAYYPLMSTISTNTVSVMSCRNSGNSYAKHFVIRYTK